MDIPEQRTRAKVSVKLPSAEFLGICDLREYGETAQVKVRKMFKTV